MFVGRLQQLWHVASRAHFCLHSPVEGSKKNNNGYCFNGLICEPNRPLFQRMRTYRKRHSGDVSLSNIMVEVSAQATTRHEVHYL